MPIIVGITGHRDLDPADLATLGAAITAIMDKLVAEYPSTPLLVLTPLAQGADQLMARIAIARGTPYMVPLPMPVEQYREDFDAAGKTAFDELLRGAIGSYAMPFFADNDSINVADANRRAHQYALVGAHIARRSHVLIALWNGEPSTAVGGTAQVVRYRTYGVPKRYLPHPAILDAVETGIVHHVYARRTSVEQPTRPVGTRERLMRSDTAAPGNPYPLRPLSDHDPEPFEPVYRRIKEFNDDCRALAATASDAPSATERLRHAAETVATHYQVKTRTALRRLFVVTAAAALLLAVYAHLRPDLHVFVVPYAVALVLAVTLYRGAKMGRWQDRSQDDRALEMGLRIQRVWDLAGLGISVADYYIRRQRSELDWIREAIRTVHSIDRDAPFDETQAITAVRTFIEEQSRYFSSASEREKAIDERYERYARWTLFASFAASGVLVIFGLAMSAGAAASVAPELLEHAHGIIIFTITAATIIAALLHEYPQRRAFHAHASRYAVMRAIYQRAVDALDEAALPAAQRDADDDAPASTRVAVATEIILDIGREALTENGDWVLLHRELPIELLRV